MPWAVIQSARPRDLSRIHVHWSLSVCLFRSLNYRNISTNSVVKSLPLNKKPKPPAFYWLKFHAVTLKRLKLPKEIGCLWQCTYLRAQIESGGKNSLLRFKYLKMASVFGPLTFHHSVSRYGTTKRQPSSNTVLHNPCGGIASLMRTPSSMERLERETNK